MENYILKAFLFGLQYYSLDITYFKSTLDSHLLDLLWNKYWVNTLSSSPLLGNRDYVAGQVADLGKHLSSTLMFWSQLRIFLNKSCVILLSSVIYRAHILSEYLLDIILQWQICKQIASFVKKVDDCERLCCRKFRLTINPKLVLGSYPSDSRLQLCTFKDGICQKPNIVASLLNPLVVRLYTFEV